MVPQKPTTWMMTNFCKKIPPWKLEQELILHWFQIIINIVHGCLGNLVGIVSTFKCPDEMLKRRIQRASCWILWHTLKENLNLLANAVSNPIICTQHGRKTRIIVEKVGRTFSMNIQILWEDRKEPPLYVFFRWRNKKECPVREPRSNSFFQ